MLAKTDARTTVEERRFSAALSRKTHARFSARL